MITEDYVSFEIAKLLKEKGLDCTCKVWYAEHTSVWGGDPSGDRKYIVIQFDDKNMADDSYKFLCYAPTLQVAMKWLREKHKIHIVIDYTFKADANLTKEYVSYCYQAENANTSISYVENIWYDTYEEACEAAIKYCLENLI